MNVFLFTNFFPHKKAEPFLVNEYGFTKKYSNPVFALSLYGNAIDPAVGQGPQLSIFQPPLSSASDKKKLFVKGVFNLAPFGFHASEFFRKRLFLSPKKLYWFFISCLITRITLASTAYRQMLAAVLAAQSPVLYFYWSDNLCWLIPYLRKELKDKKVTIVVRFHGTDLYEHLKADYAPLRSYIVEQADLLVPISENGKNYLAARYPQAASKLYLSRLGVFDKGLNQLSNSGRRKYIISVASVVPVKRLHLIYEALQHTHSSITWHHFGDGPLFADLQRLAENKRAGLEIVLHGFVSNEALMQFYTTHPVHLLLNSSESEGLPVSIMEAFSFGVPVIAPRIGGIPELVNEATGRLVPQHFDPKEMAAAIEELLTLDDQAAQQLRKNARITFEEEVSAEKNYTEFYETLKALAVASPLR